MDNEIQEIIDSLNLSEEENLSKTYLKYLQNLNQSDQLKELAKKINWKIILELFDIEFNKLEKSFVIPENIPEIKDIKYSYRNTLLNHLKSSLFYLMTLELNEFINNSEKNISEINKRIIDHFNYYMNSLFTVFEFQTSLIMLNETNNKRIIITKLEELKNKAKFGEKFRGKNLRPYEKEAFDKIIQAYNEKLKDGEKQSFKFICNKIAKNDLGYIHEKERNDFYKRFTEYKRKIKSD